MLMMLELWLRLDCWKLSVSCYRKYWFDFIDEWILTVVYMNGTMAKLGCVICQLCRREDGHHLCLLHQLVAINLWMMRLLQLHYFLVRSSLFENSLLCWWLFWQEIVYSFSIFHTRLIPQSITLTFCLYNFLMV